MLFRSTPAERPVRLLDVDALYRGPVAAAGRWSGIVMLRLYGAAQMGAGKLAERTGEGFTAWARSCDRPYRQAWAAAAQFAAICVVLAIILVARR